jgi:phosphoglycolate phosphatase-like HAD superfamily hydrolase
VPLAVILDIDGTLVDSNYHHAIAWHRAFRRHDVTFPMWRIHRVMGMGGDLLVAALGGDELEARCGDAIREDEKELYGGLVPEVLPLPGARELVVALGERGHRVVLASSAKQEEVDHYLDLLDLRGVAHDWTTSADVEATKPNPDLIRAALERAGGGDAVVIGDSTFDCEAALRAGIGLIVAVLTGGISEGELRDSGAADVYESVAELCRRLDETPLGVRAG